MFDDLSSKFSEAFKSLSGKGRISEVNIAETVREIRRALLDADVNYDVAREFTRRIKETAEGEAVISKVSPGQMFTKIVYDELVRILGRQKEEIKFSSNPPTIILMSGLQGSGKTTFSAKLANLLKQQGKKPMLAAADVYRPAAVEQLKTLGNQIGVPVFSIEEKNAVIVATEALAACKKAMCDVLIVDTAGRLHIDEAMMTEVAKIKDILKPHETLFVVDAMTGQDAVNTARDFNARIDFDGVVLSKLDGDTRGGAALSVTYVVEKPIKFMSTGEKMDAISEFYPDRMAQRILGMGDVISLVERAQQQIDEEQAAKINAKIRSNTFNLEDFLDQLQQIKKLGSMKDLMAMIPGMGSAMKDLPMDDNALKPIEAIIHSMTLKERRNPDIINASRRKRIAEGSGTSVKDVNDLLKQFEQMRKMMKSMTNMGKMGRMMQGLGGLGRSLPRR
jgi:signal recognition particle subunit SRP54